MTSLSADEGGTRSTGGPAGTPAISELSSPRASRNETSARPAARTSARSDDEDADLAPNSPPSVPGRSPNYGASWRVRPATDGRSRGAPGETGVTRLRDPNRVGRYRRDCPAAAAPAIRDLDVRWRSTNPNGAGEEGEAEPIHGHLHCGSSRRCGIFGGSRSPTRGHACQLLVGSGVRPLYGLRTSDGVAEGGARVTARGRASQWQVREPVSVNELPAIDRNLKS